ncbi:MAG: LysM peptidoglycan-binding domain-containing protein [Anaerolineales bacterium]|nr:LysM peptidoglycan-binding domain-containing protein [Anaerolineales bacterium]
MSRSAQARHRLLVFALAATAWLATLGSYAHAQAQGKVHVVAPGETLAAIAKQHDVSVNALLRTNQLSDPNRVATTSIPSNLAKVLRQSQQLTALPPSHDRTQSFP